MQNRSLFLCLAWYSSMTTPALSSSAPKSVLALVGACLSKLLGVGRRSALARRGNPSPIRPCEECSCTTRQSKKYFKHHRYRREQYLIWIAHEPKPASQERILWVTHEPNTNLQSDAILSLTRTPASLSPLRPSIIYSTSQGHSISSSTSQSPPLSRPLH